MEELQDCTDQSNDRDDQSHDRHNVIAIHVDEVLRRRRWEECVSLKLAAVEREDQAGGSIEERKIDGELGRRISASSRREWRS